MESLIAAQQELFGRIARTYDNVRKVGSAKITTPLVQSTLALLDQKWARFEEQHGRLRSDYWEKVKTHEYFAKDFIAQVEDVYVQQRAALLELEQSLAGARTTEALGRSGSQASAEGHHSLATLPRIQLPQFSGRVEDWPAFRDLFTSLICKEGLLTKVEKLHYLKASVKGGAEDLIKNLPVTEENFLRAWKMLTSHYENKRLLVRAYLSSFTALPRMKTESAGDLRRILTGMMTTAASLEGIGRSIANSSDLFVHLVVDLLDARTRRDWETVIGGLTDPPSCDELRCFLEKKLNTLDALSSGKSDGSTSKGEHSTRVSRVLHVRAQDDARKRCQLCSKPHFILYCSKYKAKSAADRKDAVQRHNLCFNCLGRHFVNACGSSKLCVHCSAKHHSSLHDACVSEATVDGPAAALVTSRVTQQSLGRRRSAFLATACVRVTDRMGNLHLVRALIDPGSELSLICESLVQRLRLSRLAAATTVSGVGCKLSDPPRGQVFVSVASRFGLSVGTVCAHVLPCLTSYGLQSRAETGEWSFVRGLNLADPDPFACEEIELLIGVDVFPRLILDGVRKDPHEQLVAQCTTLGWIVSGTGGGLAAERRTTVHSCSSVDELAASVRRFWEQEEVPRGPTPLTREEELCMKHFASTHSRLATGRFVVRLPFRADPVDLSTTRHAAVQMMKVAEHRFRLDPAFRNLYENCMEEFLQLGHMSLTTSEDANPGGGCFLPHHGVLKNTGGKVKLRVVFNGSAKSCSGLSLNELLHVGPNLLPRLADVLLRWRRHRFVFAADVEKMYRQIEVHPEDRVWQRIVWRTDGSLKEYQLNTVTYGIASAPFLAIRSLQQLASDEGNQFPLGAATLRDDTYVDDILTGAPTIAEALSRRRQLEQITERGCFPLRKWATNEASILEGIAPEHHSDQSARVWRAEEPHSTLGLEWHPLDDCFSFSLRNMKGEASTRRAKCIIQSTWMRRVGWDDCLPNEDVAAWETLRGELCHLRSLRIPRWVGLASSRDVIELHGFADASERAYAAVLYLRVKGLSDVRTSLLLARTRVAPLKQVSLPRLELCAASLLTEAAVRAVDVLRVDSCSVHLWTDSTVALGWIRGHPCRWTTFVANRVADIQRSLPEAQWHHIAGTSNPADCVSRGIAPRDLISHSLWWNGPDFLRAEEWSSPALDVDQQELPERRKTVALTTTEVQESEMLTRHSSSTRLLRVTAWMWRWRTAKARSHGQALTLSPEELRHAECLWIRHAQLAAYSSEINLLTAGRPLRSGSTLTSLTPFLDSGGVLRVGGRLKHAILTSDERHPIILPTRSHLSRLIVEAHHRRTLHGGVQLTVGLVRRKYWIPRGRQLTKSIIRECAQCVRWRAASPRPLMANLPTARATQCRPFLRTGIDYAGPIQIRTSRGRGSKAFKAFIAIFVCCSSRAVHLEVASDYSADAFLAAFRRFTSRRGACRDVHSDCGTNFVGADSQLQALFQASSKSVSSIIDHLTTEGTTWHFNPPGAPHFGGLWEAAVKSVKHHLRRVVGTATLTFEELTTLLAEVEACLNSRPLQALTDDPADLAALTPGHFLIGEPLRAIPEPTLIDLPGSRLDRWRLLQQMRDHFWTRWSQEYLASLVTRPKWRRESEKLQVGQLCLIRSESTAPSRWPLARITRLHEGDGDQTRVVTVRTATTELTRPVVKIVPFPFLSCSRETAEHAE